MSSVAAYVLAGGQSSRMGADKAFLELAGKPLIARTVELARDVTDQVAIVGDPQKLSAYGPVVSDIFRGCGPLGGIHAALANSDFDLNVILAVDLPFLTSRFLKLLIGDAQVSGATVTVPSTRGYFHPLCAVYRKQFAETTEHALKLGKNKIDALFREVELRVISEEELAGNGFDELILRNVNTPDDWEQAKSEFGW